VKQVIIDGSCDASFNSDNHTGYIAIVIKLHKSKTYYLQEKLPVICETSNQAEYLAIGRLIKRLNELQAADIIPLDSSIKLYGDNKTVIQNIKEFKGINCLDKNIRDDILAQYRILLSNNNDIDLSWVKRTKNKEAHRLIGGNVHRHIVQYQIVSDYLID
jgi:ribonuclease HI